MLAETYASVNYLSRNFLVKKIVGEIAGRIDGTLTLFGSFAKGELTKQSDVDLFVMDGKKRGATARDVVREIGDMVGREISVKFGSKEQFLRGIQESDPLVREVVSSHIVLRGVDDFCDLMWRYYARR